MAVEISRIGVTLPIQETPRLVGYARPFPAALRSCEVNRIKWSAAICLRYLHQIYPNLFHITDVAIMVPVW